MTTALLASIRYGVSGSPVLSGARSVRVYAACAYLDDLLVLQIYQFWKLCILGLKTDAVKRLLFNKASVWQSKMKTRNETVTKQSHSVTCDKEEIVEALDELTGVGGGAERGRTAASQFCRLLP